jgi:DNA-dependent RNA polymerase auxiliary subunit epsilon
MNKFKHTALAALFGMSVVTSMGALAAGTPMTSDRMAAKEMTDGREALMESGLKGQDVATIRKKLSDMGYQITAVNDLDKDYVEYEVVKGKHSYEVQVDLDTATRRATKVDVTTNLWRADSTKAALKGAPFTTMNTKDFSDRTYMKAWTDEKDMLEKTLGTGHEGPYYKTKLAQLGYKVSAVNDSDKDYLEVEVVKGRNSYEVQVDIDEKTGKSTKVDVTSNLWEAEGTEKAKAK